MNYSENLEGATLRREITLFLEEGGLYRKSKEIHQLNLYPQEAVRQLLEQAGFAVAMIDNYAGTVLRRHNVGFIAEKGSNMAP